MNGDKILLVFHVKPQKVVTFRLGGFFYGIQKLLKSTLRYWSVLEVYAPLTIRIDCGERWNNLGKRFT